MAGTSPDELRVFFQHASDASGPEKADAILGHLVALSNQFSEVRKELAEAKEEMHRQAEATAAHIRALRGAFPAEDTIGHRAYHDEVIAVTRARKEFWQKLFFELAKWGLLGFVGWLFVAGWSAFLKGPK